MTRASSRRQHRVLGSFVVRAPLLAFDTLVGLGDGLTGLSSADPDTLERDRVTVLERLRALVRDPVVREALFCASPSLHEAIGAWLEDARSARARGVTPILVRYLSRMSGRATPFGLFSSCGVGRVTGEGESVLVIDGPSEVRRHSRLDGHYLTALVDALEKDPQLRAVLHYTPSTGIARLGDHLHYAESETLKEWRTYKLVSLDASGPLDAALAAAEGGSTPDSIAGRILEHNEELRSADPADDHAVARAFVDDLIANQVLVSELQPCITGPEPIHRTIELLARHDAGRAAASALTEARDALASMDAAGLGLGAERYEALGRTLEGLPVAVELARLCQVDLSRGARGSTLGPAITSEIERAIEIFQRTAFPSIDGDLQRFRQRFLERYEAREVPLIEALDEELGIGFGATSSAPSGLIEGLPLGVPSTASGELDARDAFVLKRVSDVLVAGSRWELTDKDLDALETRCGRPTPVGAKSPGLAPLPDVFSAGVQIEAASRAAVEAGDFAAYMTWGGALAPLLGRFCHGDPEIERTTREILAAEEALQPDEILAEIVHLPAGRMGNILARPVLRRFEIPYLGASGAPRDAQISLSDLMVSVAGGRVRLRSRRLDRWVHPRMTTAHNALATALSPYRFLCALAHQDRAFGFGWTWGAAGLLPHLPRVTRGRVVLALEQWTIDDVDLESIEQAKGAAKLAALRAVCERRRLPRWVSFHDRGDHVLPIDLENVVVCESLLDLLKGRRSAMFQEMFPRPDALFAGGPHGRYVSEVFVPFASTRAPSTAVPRPFSPSIARRFAPGSEWTYAKLYAGPTTVDALLKEMVGPLARGALAEGEADRWFFIRYDDPDHHVRVRLRRAAGSDGRALRARVDEALESALARGLAYRVTLDTYQREVERYGGDGGMELSEAFFHLDSEVSLAIVEGLDGDGDADARWRLALVGMDRILRGMGFDLEGRRALLADLRARFGDEFFVRTPLEVELGARFRKVRAEIEALIERVPAAPSPALGAGLAAIDARTASLQPVFGALLDASRAGRLTESLESLAGSYLHMHANRVLASDHRAQELVLYDYLHRHYESQSARARKSGK